MVERKEYMNALWKWKDQQVIKVVTGLRRSGKSTLLSMFQDVLKRSGVDENQIISINFEDLQYGAVSKQEIAPRLQEVQNNGSRLCTRVGCRHIIWL